MADKIDPRAPVVSWGSDPIPQKTSGDTRVQELAKSVLPVPQQPSSSIFGTFASWFTGPRVTDSAPDASLGKEGADAVVAPDISEEESDADFVVLTSGGDEPVLEELTSAEESTFVMIDEADTAEEPKIPEALQRFRRVIKNYEDQLNEWDPQKHGAYETTGKGSNKVESLYISPFAKFDYFKRFTDLFMKLDGALRQATYIDFSKLNPQKELDALAKPIRDAARLLQKMQHLKEEKLDQEAFELPNAYIEGAAPLFAKLLELQMKP